MVVMSYFERVNSVKTMDCMVTPGSTCMSVNM